MSDKLNVNNKQDVFNHIKKIREILLAERTFIVQGDFKRYASLLQEKERLVQLLCDGLPMFSSVFEENERTYIEIAMREMLELNKKNLCLLFSYKQYQQKVLTELGLGDLFENKTSLDGKNKLFDGKA